MPSINTWQNTFHDTGFDPVTTQDLTARWSEILKERLAMYTSLRTETEATGHPTGDDWFHRAYPRFVDLISTGGLGGILITAAKP